MTKCHQDKREDQLVKSEKKRLLNSLVLKTHKATQNLTLSHNDATVPSMLSKILLFLSNHGEMLVFFLSV